MGPVPQRGSVGSIMQSHTLSGNEVRTGSEPYTAASREAGG